jgi:hypothetical protein
MARPTFVPVPRRTRVDIKSLYGIGVRLYVDGLSGFVFADADAALEEVSPTAKMPGWWPAASSPSQALIDVIPMAKLEAIAARGPRPFGVAKVARPTLAEEAAAHAALPYAERKRRADAIREAVNGGNDVDFGGAV